MNRPKPMPVAEFRRNHTQGRTPAFVAQLEAARKASQKPRAPKPAPVFAPQPSTYAAYIGLDPGQSTGLALLVRGQAMQVHTLEFWEAIAFLANAQARHTPLLVVIEDPNLDRSLYARHDGIAGNRRTKIAQNVGANKRDAQLLLAWCERVGIATRAVRPPGKLTAEVFTAATGIKRCSQHARDAGHLLFPYLRQ